MSEPLPEYAQRVVERASVAWWVEEARQMLLQYDAELEVKQATETNEMRKSVHSARRAIVRELLNRKPKIR